MSDLAAWVQAAFAANAPATASSVLQLAAIGFAVMDNAARERTRSEMELERIAATRAQAK
ncbi:hypothetical protein [Bradyrhizobium sp. CCBAU 45389]|uniref:hypothetical protein n=1 Tax=Bradyrhizobium sp. CCBAU 45389 TaxID=858429 RepID=UPI0023062812|nr:hypothetical protein [Bradyrhizobium sp. CCBAU 45389]MDA9398675.1 hypothetical protein [Bradyrhizobium sp. CCBAU 45389]